MEIIPVAVVVVVVVVVVVAHYMPVLQGTTGCATTSATEPHGEEQESGLQVQASALTHGIAHCTLDVPERDYIPAAMLSPVY